MVIMRLIIVATLKVKKKEEFRAEGSEIVYATAQAEVIPKLPKQETARGR